MLFRDMDRQALDAAYNNQAAVPAFAAQARQRRERTGVLRREAGARVDLAYGAEPRQTLDFFPSARPGSPLLVFIHGGYWQGGDKESSGFVAAGPLAHGFSVAVIEYTVAPQASLSAMVQEVQAAVAWLRGNASALQADGARIVLAGHSAGAQLLCTALEAPGVIGGLAISGLYDLEPIRLCYLNDKLALTAQEVTLWSPIRHLPSADASLFVAVGAAELPELVRQSRDYAAAAAAHGARAQFCAVPGHDHFSILDELAEPDGILCRQLAGFAS
jgi:arylformamidase